MKKETLKSGLVKEPAASPGKTTTMTDPASNQSLRQCVGRAMEKYFDDLGDAQLTHNLYELVLREVETPLMEAVLKHTDGNQSEAATMLGLNRGTLRKKMKQYGLL
jgi:Fis family transcriptional regulator, factor for inversion stimulation protein